MGLIPCKPSRRELLAHAVLLFFFEFLGVSDLPELGVLSLPMACKPPPKLGGVLVASISFFTCKSITSLEVCGNPAWSVWCAAEEAAEIGGGFPAGICPANWLSRARQ